MIDIYGTIGPACSDPEILKAMFREGMTGLRLNTSHISLREAADQVEMIHTAAAACGIRAKLLIDLQGPELRIGKMEPVELKDG
ncbi:MAG: pyruvate kinase, partial [Lachnospiraceae bacterium]|nr:pyruvate kinase [Lachnospiraceae bacterium]